MQHGDVVNEDADTEDKENGFDEQHQFNLRAIYTLADSADVGVSLQYGLLKATNVGDDDDSGSHYAVSAHMKNTVADFTLYSQFSYYAHNIADETPWGTGDLILDGCLRLRLAHCVKRNNTCPIAPLWRYRYIRYFMD